MHGPGTEGEWGSCVMLSHSVDRGVRPFSESDEESAWDSTQHAIQQAFADHLVYLGSP